MEIENTIENLLPDGIHEGLSFSDYRKIAAANASSLKSFKKSALHYKHSQENPWEGSGSTVIGTAAHTLILEPDNFKKEYFLLPPLDLRKTADKAAKAELIIKHIGKAGLRPEEYEAAFAIAKSVKEHRAASHYLADTKRESTCIWSTSYGRCKARIDAWKSGTLVDLKTTKSAHLPYFAKDIISLQYFVQLGFYKWGLESLGQKIEKVVIIAVENEAPYGVRIFHLTDSYLELGFSKALSYLKQLSECKRNNFFPGYPETEVVLDAPDYLTNEMED